MIEHSKRKDSQRQPPSPSIPPTSRTSWFSSARLEDRPSKRILFLDDDPRRAEMFLHRCPEAVWVSTVPDCLVQLASPWDEVHLDHDLGGEKFVDVNRDDCGMAVVRWLCAEVREPLKNTRFFIHSHNFAAASLMVECLLRNDYTAEFRPFGFDLVDFLSFEPPPRVSRGRILWRRFLGHWRRLAARVVGSRRRVTNRRPASYDEKHAASDGLKPADGLGTTEITENEP